MNITPNHNLLISTGFERPRNPRSTSAAPQDPQQNQLSNESQKSQIVQSQFNTTGNATVNQRVRPMVNAQPVLEQNLTHQGALAKDIYQEVELASEAELMPRLNILA